MGVERFSRRGQQTYEVETAYILTISGVAIQIQSKMFIAAIVK